MPPPYPLFREVLAAGNLNQALRLARDLPTIALKDAARLLALMAMDDMTDADLYERAALRWLARWTAEVRGIVLADAARAVKALEDLGQDPRALETLLELAGRRSAF